AVARAARIADADAPLAVAAAAGAVHVAAGLDDEVDEAARAEDRHRLVDGIALGDAAEGDLLALLLQARGVPRRIEDEVAPVDELLSLRDELRRRDAAVVVLVELPHSGERADRDVEGAVRHLRVLLGALEHAEELRRNLDRLSRAGGEVDARNLAGVGPG